MKQTLSGGTVFLAGVSVEVLDSAGAPPAAVRVDWHPGIPTFMRPLTLESALRQWQRTVGSLERGANMRGQELSWLPRWQLRDLDGKWVTHIRIAWTEDDKKLS